MGDVTKIGWCHHTFNGWIGCAPISAGCRFCYANIQSQRWRPGNDEWRRNGTRRVTSEATWRKPYKWNRDAEAAGERRRVFASSLADVFEDRRDLDEPRARLFEEVIPATPWLDWLFLTKRTDTDHPGLIPSLVPWGDDWPTNVWLGASVENQRSADLRIPELLKILAKILFLSVEPLISPVDLNPYVPLGCDCGVPASFLGHHEDSCMLVRAAVNWVIVGGESGPKRREMDVSWLRTVADQAVAADVPVFVKQDSALREGQQGRIPDDYWSLKQFPVAA
ncbi:MAG TPA: DUF5131 family protein [Streptosporangiaceae bacterium]|nr:DUF5131 family protein [Streptosporangiaceae bacterium]